MRYGNLRVSCLRTVAAPDLFVTLHCKHDKVTAVLYLLYFNLRDSFRFAPEDDGVRRLVTVRYECIQENPSTELLTQSLSSNAAEPGPSTSQEYCAQGTQAMH